MKYFVYYSDGCADLGEFGLKEFKTATEALDFINERFMEGNNPPEGLDELYTLVEGNPIPLKFLPDEQEIVMKA